MEVGRGNICTVALLGRQISMFPIKVSSYDSLLLLGLNVFNTLAWGVCMENRLI